MSKEKLIPDLRFPEFQNQGEWEKDSIDNQFDLQDGCPFSSFDFTKDIKDSKQVIRITDINNQNSNEEKVYLPNSKVKDLEISKYEVHSGDLLLSLTGAAGFNFFIWNTYSGFINQRTMKISPKKQDNEALKFLLEPLIHSKINSIGTGQNNNLSKDALKEIEFPFPKPKEQRKLSSFITNLNDLLAAHSQKLDVLKDHKKGLMQNLFPQDGEKVPKVRFKEFEKNGEWVEKTIDTVKSILTDYVANGSFQSLRENLNVVDSVDYAFYVRLTDLRAGLGHSNQKYVDESTYKFLNKSALYGGELLMANIGANVGEVWQMPNVNKPATLAPNMIMIKFKKDIDSEFVYQYLTSDIGVANISSVISGSGHPKISKTDLRQVKVILPPRIEEQQKIASCLSSLDALITAQAEKIEQLKLHKKGLMQGLFHKSITN